MLEPLLDEMAGLSQTPDSVRRKVHQSPPDPLADAGMVNPRTPLPYERHNRCGCHVLPLAHIARSPRVYRAARRRGGSLAARGVRAAAGSDTPDRCPDSSFREVQF